MFGKFCDTITVGVILLFLLCCCVLRILSRKSCWRMLNLQSLHSIALVIKFLARYTGTYYAFQTNILILMWLSCL